MTVPKRNNKSKQKPSPQSAKYKINVCEARINFVAISIISNCQFNSIQMYFYALIKWIFGVMELSTLFCGADTNRSNNCSALAPFNSIIEHSDRECARDLFMFSFSGLVFFFGVLFIFYRLLLFVCIAEYCVLYCIVLYTQELIQ